jgi:hypothetical protein
MCTHEIEQSYTFALVAACGWEWIARCAYIHIKVVIQISNLRFFLLLQLFVPPCIFSPCLGRSTDGVTFIQPTDADNYSACSEKPLLTTHTSPAGLERSQAQTRHRGTHEFRHMQWPNTTQNFGAIGIRVLIQATSIGVRCNSDEPKMLHSKA